MSGEVDDGSVGPLELLQEARVVVERDRARMSDAERVERVDEADLVQPVARVERSELAERPLLEHLVGVDRPEREVVGQQRVHPVDGDELLGQRVGNAVMVGGRAGDAAEDFVLAPLAQALAEDAVPVGPHRVLGRRMRNDRRRPFDGVDLRHQGGVDQARALVELVVGPARVLGLQAVADRVVLVREDRVQQRQAEPEVAGDAGQVDDFLEVARQLAVGVEPELAAFLRAQRLRESGVAAVDLRPVPPVRVGRDVRRRPALPIRRGIATRPLDPHRPVGPGVVVGQLELEGLLRDVLAVAEPVVDLELQPGSGEDVDDRGRLELVACQ